ncbi:MAG: AbrB/MazE/SpoVT family DNA-binding domain-containing protein [Desulfobacterales bacterium]|nr:MAG: AbrB/MazE/SpoVT family DNA-binding domain-containing protein [Desulfobacterales bacterium]
MKAYTITPKGQVTIPAEIREKLKLYPGDKITYEDTAAGILIKPAKKDMIADFGFLKERDHPEDLEVIRKSVRKKIAEKILR